MDYHYEVRDVTRNEPDTSYEFLNAAINLVQKLNADAGWSRFYWVRINTPF